jgi:hypothetical protein
MASAAGGWGRAGSGKGEHGRVEVGPLGLRGGGEEKTGRAGARESLGQKRPSRGGFPFFFFYFYFFYLLFF